MSISNQELLRKATLTTADFGGSNAPLKIEAADRFITLMTIGQQILNDVQVVRHTASKWQQATVQFASRIMRPGVQATRLADVDRAKPSTGLIEMSTALVKGEVVAADEVFEDNLEGDSFAHDARVADRRPRRLRPRGARAAGRHLLGRPVPRSARRLAEAGPRRGWPRPERVDTSARTTRRSSAGCSSRCRSARSATSRPTVGTTSRSAWSRCTATSLSSRGTPLGDLTLTGNNELRYQGILIKGVSTMPIVAGGADTAQILLTNKNNLYAGFRRQVTIESFRDPREGATSFIVTCRFDAKMADKDASATATNVDVTVN
jgi:hypothetical protein